MEELKKKLNELYRELDGVVDQVHGECTRDSQYDGNDLLNRALEFLSDGINKL